MAVSTTPLAIDALSLGYLGDYPHKPYIASNQKPLDYIFAADSMGLSSFKFSWWVPKVACVVQ